MIFIPVLLLKKKSCNYLYLTNLHVNTTSIKDRKSKLFPRFQILCIFCIAFLLYDLKAGLSFSGGSDGKASAYNAGDPGWVPGSGRSSGRGSDNTLWYPCLENPMDRGAWWSRVCWVPKCQIGPRGFHTLVYLEEGRLPLGPQLPSAVGLGCAGHSRLHSYEHGTWGCRTASYLRLCGPFLTNNTSSFLSLFIFNWEDNCFTMLCWLLPSINMNWS